jgi:hypothetical protein
MHLGKIFGTQTYAFWDKINLVHFVLSQKQTFVCSYNLVMLTTKLKYEILVVYHRIRKYIVEVEWYWQEKDKGLREKPVSVPLCPPQIPRGLNRAGTPVSAVSSGMLNTCIVYLMMLFSLSQII